MTLFHDLVLDTWHCWAGDQALPDIASCVLEGKRQQGWHNTLSRAIDRLQAAIAGLPATSSISSPGEGRYPVVLTNYCILLLPACMPQAACATLGRRQ